MLLSRHHGRAPHQQGAARQFREVEQRHDDGARTAAGARPGRVRRLDGLTRSAIQRPGGPGGSSGRSVHPAWKPLTTLPITGLSNLERWSRVVLAAALSNTRVVTRPGRRYTGFVFFNFKNLVDHRRAWPLVNERNRWGQDPEESTGSRGINGVRTRFSVSYPDPVSFPDPVSVSRRNQRGQDAIFRFLTRTGRLLRRKNRSNSNSTRIDRVPTS